MSAKVDLEDNANVDEVEAAGEAPSLKERQARCCEGCRAELSPRKIVCATSSASTAGEAAAKRLIERLAPVAQRRVDRAIRSLEADFRDAFRGKFRRARKLDFGWPQEDPVTGKTVFAGCIVDRWDKDPPLRKNQEDLRYAREDMDEWDDIAEGPSQAPPRRGEGRTRQATEQTEGFCERESRDPATSQIRR